MDFYLTVEQVLGLAPNPNVMRATRVIAAPEKWTSLARNQSIAWGTFAVINRPPFHAAVHLSTFATACTCTSRFSPCNHSLALLLLVFNGQLRAGIHAPPDWATAVYKHGLTINQIGNDAFEKRLRTVRRGLADLERWLHDMIRAGLAQLPNQPKAYWETMAGRLIDTRCPLLAQAVRQWQQVVSKEPDWTEQLLRQLGQTQLLIDAFRRFDTFSAEIQHDLCHALGWQIRPDVASQTVADLWQTVGSHIESRGRRRIQHTWLWGAASQRYAQLIQPVATRQHPRQQFVVGTQFEATLRFVRNTLPVHATFASEPERLALVRSLPLQPQSILALNQTFSHLRTRNFWLDAFPITLANVHIYHDNKRWGVIDQAGYRLPLAPNFNHGWHLMALPNRPLFGIWNGHYFRPMSVWVDKRWIELRHLTETKI